ncbi:MAG: hypothetical protein Q9200_003975, partial [Gallowayella weberi]
MPIFEDPEQRFFEADQTSESPQLKNVKPRVAGRGIGVGFCDGPLSESASWDDVGKNSVGQKSERKSERPSHSRGGVCTSNRNELIERLKRGESATWVPSPTLQDEYLKAHRDNALSSPLGNIIQQPTPLLPSADLQESSSSTANDPYCAELSPPSEIKRPRSALHAGDFTKGSHNATPTTTEQSASRIDSAALAAPDITGTSPTARWYIPFQPLQYSHVVSPFPERTASQRPVPIPSRSRAPSSGSLSSSYVAKAPTTPLVQQSNNTDLDFSPIDRSISPSKTSRRHTLPPRPLPCSQEHSTNGQPANQVINDHLVPASFSFVRKATIGPQPATILFIRVLTATECVNGRFLRRIYSKGLDVYCPVEALEFHRADWRHCWNGGTGTEHSTANDEPSPYVGHIDLSQLPAPAESKKTRQSRSKSPSADAARSVHMQSNKAVESGHDTERTAVVRNKRRRTSSAPSTLQGGYRIPQKGQLQIVIQNPNKTAVKLFLVPYDLEDMQAGTKTFIRQRCFSTNPVVEGLPSEHRSEPAPSLGGTSIKKKPTLRYLIHVNICSPSSGRFYLYQHIRVVFANRVPDNQEQLQTEIQIPQPRYSTYKSSLTLSRSLSSSGAGSARGKHYTRPSSGFGVGLEGMDDRHPQAFGSGTNYPFTFDSPPPPIPRIPYQLPSTQAPDHHVHFQMDIDYRSSNDRSTRSGEDSPFPISGGSPALPTPAFPFARLSTDRQRPRRNDTKNQRPAEDEAMDLDNISRPTTASSQNLQSPLRDGLNQHHLNSKRSDLSHSSGENGAFGKLNRGDVG